MEDKLAGISLNDDKIRYGRKTDLYLVIILLTATLVYAIWMQSIVIGDHLTPMYYSAASDFIIYFGELFFLLPDQLKRVKRDLNQNISFLIFINRIIC